MPKSYNGWPASPDRSKIGVENFYYRGKPFPSGVKSGDVAVVFGYLVNALATRVEPFNDGYGCWAYNYRANANNPNELSCHASGTAIDWRAPSHPNGRGNTFTPAQVREIRKILAELDYVVRWLEGYDEMHFEICKNAAAVAAVARKIQSGSTTAPTATHTNQGDKMDQADRDWVRAELNTSESQIMAAIRREVAAAVLTITGGQRVRDENGKVIDPDPANISEADSYTKLEGVLTQILAEIRSTKPA